MTKKYHKNEKKLKKRKNELLVLIIFILVCIIGIVVYNLFDDDNVTVKKEKDIDIVEINGIEYKQKQNVETYLFMGIDAKGTVRESTKNKEIGQSDVLILFVLDREKNTYATLPIHRDTLTDVDSLDDKGKVLATTKIQIALAHASGDGKEISCMNTEKAVTNFLSGQKIDGYIAVNMDAIKKLNHIIGGVTVKIEDDFSKSDKTLRIGETVKLNDNQAYHYIHDRMNVGNGSNDARMRRQSTYLKSMKEIINIQTEKNPQYPVELFDKMKEYMVTSLNGENISRISKAVLKNKDLGQYEIKGTNATDEYGYNAFTPDEDSLKQVILELFYDKVSESK